MAEALRFWLIILVIGATTLPITVRLFRRFPDVGAGLSVPLGLILAGFVFFLLRLAEVIPAGRGGATFVLVLLGAVAIATGMRDRRLLSDLRRTSPAILAFAGLFSLLFFGYAAYRSYVPEISGTEQPMDFMYLTAVIEAQSFPPPDPWFAGESISYYYFGYLQIGLLTMASGVAPEIGYNLGLAYVFAASGVAIAAVALPLARWCLGGHRRRLAVGASAIALLLFLFAGSLSTWFHVAAAHGSYDGGLFRAFGLEAIGPCDRIPAETAELGACHNGTETWYPTRFWWWFATSRVIPGTITEFPAFSFLLGDLHPHVMALPGVILVVGLSASIWRGRGALGFETHRRAPGLGLVIAALLGSLAFTNAWDAVPFPLLFAGAVAARNLRDSPSVTAAGNATAGYLGPLAAVAVIALAPWYLNFTSQAGGIRAYVLQGTTPGELFVQWGPLFLFSFVVLVAGWRRMRGSDVLQIAPFTLWLPFLPLVAWFVLALAHGELESARAARGAWGWLTLALLASLLWGLATAAVNCLLRRQALGLLLACAAGGVLLLYGAELLFVRDIFAGSVPRLNTVFKLSYQAWVLLSIAGGVSFALALRAALERPAVFAATVPAVVAAVAALAFFVFAVPERTNGLENATTLDGLAFVRSRDTNEDALLQWVRTNLGRDERIIEAPGQSYSDSARISGRTGRATALGWEGHESQWRGGSEDEGLQTELERRRLAIDALYRAGADPSPVLAAMAEFGADYVIVGGIELGRYSSEEMTDFAAFLDPVYTAGPYTIYRLPVDMVVQTS